MQKVIHFHFVSESRALGNSYKIKSYHYENAFDTPEIGEDGYEEAKEFVNETCMWEEVKLDVDDEKQFDPYYRILAVVNVNDTNLNEQLVKEGYAEVMYIPPSEFDSYAGKVDYTPSPTQTPGFELLFAIIGVVTVVCLIKRKG